MRLCDSLRPRDGEPGERGPLEGRCDPVGVVAVARLVHRRPETVEAALEARRHAHVAPRERRAERVHGRIEPIRPLFEAECRQDALVEPHLRGDGVGQAKERRVDTRCLAHQLAQDRADRREHVGDLGGQHVRLEVVEQRGIRRVVPLEALDVPPLQLEIALERGEELREVVRRPRLDPHLVAECGGACQLHAELGRDPALLLPVASRHADQRRVVGVVLQRLLERTQSIEEAADLVVHHLLVRNAAERRERLGPGGMAARRHGDLLIPGEHACRARDVGDLGESLSERTKVGVHREGLYRRR